MVNNFSKSFVALIVNFLISFVKDIVWEWFHVDWISKMSSVMQPYLTFTPCIPESFCQTLLFKKNVLRSFCVSLPFHRQNNSWERGWMASNLNKYFNSQVSHGVQSIYTSTGNTPNAGGGEFLVNKFSLAHKTNNWSYFKNFKCCLKTW